MTKKTIQTKLTSLGIAFKSRDTKDTLEALLKNATEKKHSKPPASQATTRSPSTKAVLRQMFDKKGIARSVDEVYKALSAVKPETVDTMCGDLRNPKYSDGETVDIRKEEGNFVRIG